MTDSSSSEPRQPDQGAGRSLDEQRPERRQADRRHVDQPPFYEERRERERRDGAISGPEPAPQRPPAAATDEPEGTVPQEFEFLTGLLRMQHAR